MLQSDGDFAVGGVRVPCPHTGPLWSRRAHFQSMAINMLNWLETWPSPGVNRGVERVHGSSVS